MRPAKPSEINKEAFDEIKYSAVHLAFTCTSLSDFSLFKIAFIEFRKFSGSGLHKNPLKLGLIISRLTKEFNVIKGLPHANISHLKSF